MTRPPAARLCRRARAPGIALGLGLAVDLAACTAPPADETTSTAATSTTGTDGSASDTESPPATPTPAVNCSGAPTIRDGRFSGTLRGVAIEPSGACGQPGPTTYLRVATDLRVDLEIVAQGVAFTPQIEIGADVCLQGQGVACGEGGVVGLADLLPGSTWLIRIGAAHDDPALALPAPEDGSPDPLAFTVDVARRLVLDPGDLCTDGDESRCPTGTLCAPTEDADDDPTLRICTPLVGDTCEDAEPLVIDALAGALEIDLDAPQTDAHAHGCAGAGTRERVLRAELAADFPAAAELVLTTTTPNIDLAVRAPSCDLEGEVACEIGGPAGTSLTIDDPAALAAAGHRPWIFVEWPDDAAGGATLEWSVVGE